MLKKLIIMLAALFALSPSVFADNTYFTDIRGYNGEFDLDISGDDWFYDNAVTLYKLGLSNGYDGMFSPYEQLSVAEAVTFAARLHSIYYTGSPDAADNFSEGDEWYTAYFDYALQNGIIDDRFTGMENEPALRKYAAYIFSFVFPMEDINYVADEDIPDLDEEYAYYISSVYNKGIITGTDTLFTFSPDNPLLRCEAAAIVTRCALPDMRISGLKKSSYAASMPEAEYTDGIIVVSYSGNGEGSFSFHKKSENGVWEELITVPCYVGRNGINKTSEGDGKTPSGTFPVGIAFGNEEEPGTELEYIQADDSHYWVDDPSSEFYNRLVSTYDVDMDWSSAEHLADYETAYAYAINIEYNPECVPGLGSAIFIHCSTGNPTAGCIAIDRSSMVELLWLITPDTVVVIGE